MEGEKTLCWAPGWMLWAVRESMGGRIVPGAVLGLGQEHRAAGRCCLLRNSLERVWLFGSLDIDFHVPFAFISARRQKSSVGSGSMPVTTSAEHQSLPVSPQGSPLPFQGQGKRNPAHAGDNGWVSLRRQPSSEPCIHLCCRSDTTSAFVKCSHC